MFICRQYRLGQIQQSCHFVVYLCQSHRKWVFSNLNWQKNSVRQWSHMQEPSSPIKLKTEFFILEIEIIAKIINDVFFSLLLIIAMHRGLGFFMPASLKLSMYHANWNEELFKITTITTVCYKKIHSLYKHIRFMARPGPIVPGS